MKGGHIVFRSTNDNWRTPDLIYETLQDEFYFNFDPCPLNHSPKENGLNIEWGSRTFVNPPFSSIKKWCEKAYKESRKGKLIVMLIPSRTDTQWWHDYIMKADEIRFIKGRLKFSGHPYNAPFPSAIAIFKPRSPHAQAKT